MSSEFLKDRKSLFILTALLLVIGYVQFQNMFRFPYYQDVEGTNVSNALALVETGALSPYTYAYDQPPAGTFIIGGWMVAANSVIDSLSAIDMGRVLMLVLHVLTTGLVYATAKKLTKSDVGAVIAALVFSLSPLVTSLQRQVLLDNIMIFSLMFAFYLIVGERRLLSHYMISAFAFSLAVLTKTDAFWFLPAFMFIIITQANPHHRRFAGWLWITITLLLIALYPMYAQMKQELFPQGWLFGGDFPHVSLLERLMDRGVSNGNFLGIGSGLSYSFDNWTNLANETADPVLIGIGMVAALFVFLISIDNKRVRPLLIMLIGFAMYLLLSGQVYNTHIIPALPLLALAIAVVVSAIFRLLNGSNNTNAVRWGFSALVAVGLLYPVWVFYGSRLYVYEDDQVTGQLKAIEWIQRNIPEDAVIVTDNYAFVDLRESHPNTQHYWRIDTDPAIKYNLLEDNLCNIDYMLTTPQVNNDINTYGMDLLKRTFDQSEALVTYENNGWPVQIRQVSKANCVEEQEQSTKGTTPSTNDSKS